MSNTKDTNNNRKIGGEPIYFTNLKLHEQAGVGFILFTIIAGGIYIYIYLPEDHWLKELISDLIKVEKEDIV